MMTVRRSLKSRKMQVVDTSAHKLVVYDGQRACGTITERGNAFDAYTADGRFLGTFSDLRAAARSIPRVAYHE
jgi:hypothetical protein